MTDKYYDRPPHWVDGKLSQQLFADLPVHIYLDNVRRLIEQNQAIAFGWVMEETGIPLDKFNPASIHLGLPKSSQDFNAHAVWIDGDANSRVYNNYRQDDVAIRIIATSGAAGTTDDQHKRASAYLSGIRRILETVLTLSPQELTRGWPANLPLQDQRRLSPVIPFTAEQGGIGYPGSAGGGAISITQGRIPRLVINFSAKLKLAQLIHSA